MDAAKRIERLSRRLEDLLHAADNLDDCESGALLERLAAPPSFAFLCRFGFYAPSVATGRECSVDLSRRMIEEALVVADATWSIDATVGILDELLGQACAESGGILLRNLGAGEAAPLYSAYCAESGRRVRTHFLRNTIALGMEEEPTGDCFLARFDAAAAGDPCGGYGLPPAGGGSDPSPPLPDDGDCLIVRMEEEPTGCE